MVYNWRSEHTLQRKLDSAGCTWGSTVPGKYSNSLIKKTIKKTLLDLVGLLATKSETENSEIHIEKTDFKYLVILFAPWTISFSTNIVILQSNIRKLLAHVWIMQKEFIYRILSY